MRRCLSCLYVVISLTVVACLSSLGFAAPLKTPQPHVYLFRVTLKPGADVEQLKKRLPKDLKIIASEGPLVVVRARKNLSHEEVRKVSSLPEVEEVRPDRIVRPDQNRSPVVIEACPTCSSVRTGDASLEKASRQWAELEKKMSCSLFEKCGSPPQRRFWAAEATDSDLAREELKKMGADLSTVKVAVLDTGFDQKNQRQNFPGNIQTVKAFEDAEDPKEDPQGHGTSVASMVGGKAPYGMAPGVNLSIYRVTIDSGGTIGEREEDFSSDSLLEIAMLKACRDGNSIINVSWGDLFDDVGVSKNKKHYEEFIQKMGEKGCLVTKASGNMGNKNLSTQLDAPDDAILRVGASNREGKEAWFSTAAEVLAPGEQVQALKSKGSVEDRELNQLPCSNGESHSIDGTSFAAPATAGLAALLRAALNSSPKFAALSPREQVRLMTRILTASQTKMGINGLASVKIAQKWMASDGNPSVPETSDLKKLLSEKPVDPVCRSGPASGELDQVNCENVHAKIVALRKQVTLCQSSSPEVADDARDQLVQLAALFRESEYFVQLKAASEKPLSESTVALLKDLAISSARRNPPNLVESVRFYSSYVEQTKKKIPDLEERIKEDIVAHLSSSQGADRTLARKNLEEINSQYNFVDFKMAKDIVESPQFNFHTALTLGDSLASSQISPEEAEKILRLMLHRAKRKGFFDEVLSQQSRWDRFSNFFTGDKNTQFRETFLGKVFDAASSKKDPKMYRLIEDLANHPDFSENLSFTSISALHSPSVPESKKLDYLDTLLRKPFVNDTFFSTVTRFSLESFSPTDREKAVFRFLGDRRAGTGTYYAVADSMKAVPGIFPDSSAVLAKVLDGVSRLKPTPDKMINHSVFIDAIAKSEGSIPNRGELMARMVRIVRDHRGDEDVADSVRSLTVGLENDHFSWADRNLVFDELEGAWGKAPGMKFYYQAMLQELTKKAPSEEIRQSLERRLTLFLFRNGS